MCKETDQSATGREVAHFVEGKMRACAGTVVSGEKAVNARRLDH